MKEGYKCAECSRLVDDTFAFLFYAGKDRDLTLLTRRQLSEGNPPPNAFLCREQIKIIPPENFVQRGASGQIYGLCQAEGYQLAGRLYLRHLHPAELMVADRARTLFPHAVELIEKILAESGQAVPTPKSGFTLEGRVVN